MILIRICTSTYALSFSEGRATNDVDRACLSGRPFVSLLVQDTTRSVWRASMKGKEMHNRTCVQDEEKGLPSQVAKGPTVSSKV